MQSMLLIIPCFNEAKRINLATFAQAPSHISFLFADDASTDNTVALLEAWIARNKQAFKQRMQIYRGMRNRGKGHLIRAAFLSLRESARITQYDWIGFCDADLEIPLDQVGAMLRYHNEFYADEKISAIFASRIPRLGANLTQHWFRKLLSTLFRIYIRLLFSLRAYDTQCGAKLFTPTAARKAFKAPFINAWTFDIEIVLRIDPTTIIEYPLKTLNYVAGSNIDTLNTGRKIFVDLLKIRKKYLQK